MFTRGAHSDANAKCTLDASTPASGRSVLTAVRSLLRCAPRRTLARVPPFVLRSSQNPAFPYRLKRRGVQGEPHILERKCRFCLPPLHPPKGRGYRKASVCCTALSPASRRPEASSPSAWWLVSPLTARSLPTEAVHLVALLLYVFAKPQARSCEGVPHLLTSHRPLTFVRGACSVLACVRSVVHILSLSICARIATRGLSRCLVS